MSTEINTDLKDTFYINFFRGVNRGSTSYFGTYLNYSRESDNSEFRKKIQLQYNKLFIKFLKQKKFTKEYTQDFKYEVSVKKRNKKGEKDGILEFKFIIPSEKLETLNKKIKPKDLVKTIEDINLLLIKKLNQSLEKEKQDTTKLIPRICYPDSWVREPRNSKRVTRG